MPLLTIAHTLRRVSVLLLAKLTDVAPLLCLLNILLFLFADTALHRSRSQSCHKRDNFSQNVIISQVICHLRRCCLRVNFIFPQFSSLGKFLEQTPQWFILVLINWIRFVPFLFSYWWYSSKQQISQTKFDRHQFQNHGLIAYSKNISIR